MKSSLHITGLSLLILVLIMTAVVIYYSGQPGFSLLILSLSALKFLLVVFGFMDLYHAHRHWKVTMLITTILLFAMLALMVS